jgi:hypothetical protein
MVTSSATDSDFIAASRLGNHAFRNDDGIFVAETEHRSASVGGAGRVVLQALTLALAMMRSRSRRIRPPNTINKLVLYPTRASSGAGLARDQPEMDHDKDCEADCSALGKQPRRADSRRGGAVGSIQGSVYPLRCRLKTPTFRSSSA